MVNLLVRDMAKHTLQLGEEELEELLTVLHVVLGTAWEGRGSDQGHNSLGKRNK